mmetsp:Transcript_21916/g.50090  ORF Transcript_21916/g.50090 Transcript_21916/m.50090 type:complete len:362 (-) Transcript_21916:1372-2457(-)
MYGDRPATSPYAGVWAPAGGRPGVPGRLLWRFSSLPDGVPGVKGMADSLSASSFLTLINGRGRAAPEHSLTSTIMPKAFSSSLNAWRSVTSALRRRASERADSCFLASLEVSCRASETACKSFLVTAALASAFSSINSRWSCSCLMVQASSVESLSCNAWDVVRTSSLVAISLLSALLATSSASLEICCPHASFGCKSRMATARSSFVIVPVQSALEPTVSLIVARLEVTRALSAFERMASHNEDRSAATWALSAFARRASSNTDWSACALASSTLEPRPSLSKDMPSATCAPSAFELTASLSAASSETIPALSAFKLTASVSAVVSVAQVLSFCSTASNRACISSLAEARLLSTSSDADC